MPIKYTKSKINEIKFHADDFLVFPTDYKIQMFPATLKNLLPHSFEVFKELSMYIKSNNATIPHSFFFPPTTNLRLVSIVCIESNKQIYYKELFNTLEYINDENTECTVYIFEELFNPYLQNFEVFEYDIEQEFSGKECTIVIVNEQKDYKYDVDEEQKAPKPPRIIKKTGS